MPLISCSAQDGPVTKKIQPHMAVVLALRNPAWPEPWISVRSAGEVINRQVFLGTTPQRVSIRKFGVRPLPHNIHTPEIQLKAAAVLFQVNSEIRYYLP